VTGGTGGRASIAALSASTRSAGRQHGTRIVRWFDFATQEENWVLKSSGPVKDRPGRNEVS